MATEDEIIDLSRKKWRWMSERQVEALSTLFHARAVFVHMGATMTKDQEIEVIRTGAIQYKDIEIEEIICSLPQRNDSDSSEQDPASGGS